MAEIKNGRETSEYEQAKSAGVMGWVALILGVLTTQGALLLEKISAGHEGATWAIVAGAVVAFAGLVQTTLAKLGYIKSRSDVKVAAEKRAAAEVSAKRMTVTSGGQSVMVAGKDVEL